MREYTTERGIKIGIMPIPLLLEQVRKAHPEPALPTYTQHLAGGATQEVPITPVEAQAWAAENPESWAPHATEWETYQAEATKRDKATNDAIWRAILMRAVQVDLPTDDTWVDDLRSLGIDVPDNPRDRRILYLDTEAIGGARDIVRITAIAGGADVTEEALSAAEESFRGLLERKSSIGVARAAGTVVDELADGATAGGARMAPAT